MKYAWISEHRDSFPVALMCQLLQVSRSGYYDSVDRPRSKRAKRTAKIHASVRQVFEQHHTIYGPAKIAEQLQQREELETACRNTVARAMKEMGLKSRVRKRFTPTTTKADPSKRPAPNVLDRDFDAERPNQKWVTDITYLPTLAGWVYVAVVVDLFSRKVVGWSMSHSLATPLVSDALRQAIESRRPQRGELLHHSDRGCQYTSESYQRTLQTLGIECSMSRRGNCYDNAVAERFFWSLKHEWTKHYEYADLESARLSVFKYIEVFYNRQRLHQSLGYKTPEAFEAEYAPAVAA
ncbi:IS3 family transposase [Aeoliella mucimassa]|uniref:Integrase core domain protein n=1 Tax=Aeoliella mucimassa TaxID=2527972 RepID=A0A518AMH7_9BACT|nr:IS3 family transposase [Aeoliella mucimassa]QDU55939.1 Integrase core domain protein [Aeoliella mucimassa]